MNILIVSQYFSPENFRVNDLALDLRERGHNVTVLTGMPNYPGGRFFQGYGLFGKYAEMLNGIKIKRVPIVSRGKSRGFRLALNYISFACFASLLGPFFCRDQYDVIFVFEPSPITVGIPAIILKKLKKAPIFFWVLDLWPESLSATGTISFPPVIKLIAVLCRFIYRHCDRILVSSKGFIDRIVAAGIPVGKIYYFPNWTEDVYWRAAEKQEASRLTPLPEGFKIVFAGNVGVAQSFPTILGAAERLRDISDIQWIIIGQGRMLDWVKGEIENRRLRQRVHLIGWHTPENVARYISSGDALLVTLKRDPIFSLTVPGKIQSYLACGKPIIASLDGEGARLINEAMAGISCPAEDAAALAGAALALRNMKPELRCEMGRRGYLYCKSNFSRSGQLEKLDAWLKDSLKI